MDHSPEQGDIAIVGMSCRVAGASSPSELWDNLVTSKDVQTKIDRFSGYYHPDGGRRKGLTNVSHAYTIRDGVESFDNTFFSITPNEAVAMDVQQRLLLELTYEAFENAGITLDNVRGTDTAVYAGVLGSTDFTSSLVRDLDSTPKYMATGAAPSIIANRISYFFDIHGPSMVIDTACSSTMVALHQAVMALKSRESKMAVVAGANVVLDPAMFVHMSELGFFSPTGRCRSFDAGGNGYVRGEGILALVLKPLRDAMQDGDNVRAVIKATRVNQDGRTQGLTMPSSDAQRANLEAIYADNNVNPLDIQYVEAHGTGTAIGDPLELSAINAVFTPNRLDDPLVVGSIKSNVGHLEPSAALAGLVKSVLALEQGKIPPQMHLETLNPKIDWSKIRVPLTTEDWPAARSGKRMAAVNSFGFGGTNGHAILQAHSTRLPPSATYNRPYLFMVSAMSNCSLSDMQERLASHVMHTKPDLPSLAHTLLARRSALRLSKFFTASSHRELVEKLRHSEGDAIVRSEEQAGSLTFVFTGQGAQWPEMGAQMIAMSPLFKSVMEELDGHLSQLPEKPSWSIADELSKSKQTSRVYISSFSQPLCSAIQIGLVDVLSSWGIRPDCVVGHSSGEVAAAYAAGILSRRDAIIVAFYRGLFLGQDKSIDPNIKPAGAMCAVGVSEQDALNLISAHIGRVALAAVNSPSSCTLSGDYDAVQEIIDYCSKEGIFCRALRVDMAYHSHHMLPKGGLYQNAMEQAGVQPLVENQNRPRTMMFSSVFGRLVKHEECDPAYWKRNMVSTVQFHRALTAAATALPPKMLLEIGPHPALKGPAEDSLAAMTLSGVPYVATLSRAKPDFESLLQSVGSLISNRASFSIHAVNALEKVNSSGEIQHEFGNVLKDLPGYCWNHSQSFSAESRVSLNTRYRKFPRHELLGARLPMDNPLRLMWRNLLMTDEITWLKDIIDTGIANLPESVYLAMVLEAARQVQLLKQLHVENIRLQDIRFNKAFDLSLFSSGKTTIETFCALCQTGDRTFDFSITLCSDTVGNSWDEVCTGEIQLLEQKSSLAQQAKPVIHDAQALQYLETFGDGIVEKLSAYNVSSDAISGSITNDYDDLEHYHLDPIKFANVMGLSQYLLAAQSSHLHTNFRLSKISCINVPAGEWKLNTGTFKIDVCHCGVISGLADLVISDDEGDSFLIQGMQWNRLQGESYSPPLRSLFFDTHLRPDISVIDTLDAITLGQVVELTTYKWPMADIVVASLEEPLHDEVLPYLQGLKHDGRKNFRSLTLVANDTKHMFGERVNTKQSLREVTANSSQLVFGRLCDTASLIPVLQDFGIFCAIFDDGEIDSALADTFVVLGTTPKINGRKWLVARKSPTKEKPKSPSKIVAFATDDARELFKKQDAIEVIPLDRYREWTPTADLLAVIVLDFGKQSILIDWQGSEILPWIQSLVERTAYILWVGRDTEQFVAPSFTKTIHAEHPEVKTAALLLQNSPENKVEQLILNTFDALTNDRAEAEQYFVDEVLHIKRYQPDDLLSASVGKLPPTVSTDPVGKQHYALAITSPGMIALTATRSPRDIDLNEVQVHIHHSLVDWSDAQVFRSGAASKPNGHTGFFCAGIVTKSSSGRLQIGDTVIAWSSGAHTKLLNVSENQVIVLDEACDLIDELFKCSLAALALCVLVTARAHPGDVFHTRGSETLSRTLEHVWRQLEGQYIPSFIPNHIFEVEFHKTNGVLVNGTSVKLSEFLRPQVQEVFRTIDWEGIDLPLGIKHFDFANAQEAFEHACSNKSLAVSLDHEHVPATRISTVTYMPPEHLFSDNKAYIIVGLGGLARHIAAWMAQNGAKHIFAMSRSGLDSKDAREAVKTLKAFGSNLNVLKVDACDQSALRAAFDNIRLQYPIGGILNMVMVLGDSSLLTMEPRQWDQCMTAKVQSTRNTHLTSLEDNLEFFIMFSSIASIAGNRAQANYATANAFQNAFARYRQSLGLTGIAIALGAVTGVGVLADDHTLLRHFSQVGYYHITAPDLEKILEAAINESRFRDRSILTTGFQMFKTLDGQLQSKPEENQVYWAESPEFGFMMEHDISGPGASKDVSLKDKLTVLAEMEAQELLLEGVLSCLSNVLGYDSSVFDPKSPVSVYGCDSLNAVSVRYWFFTQLGIGVPVFDILGCRSISELVSRSLVKFYASLETTDTIEIPEPVRHKDLAIRPLSHSQQRLFFLQRFIPDKTAFNLLLICEASGRIDIDRFRATWNIFLQRHEVLYSRIVSTDDGFQQIPRQSATFSIEHTKIGDIDYEQTFQSLEYTAKNYQFNLEEGELVRGYLLESPTKTKFLLASHHLAWDRTSASTVFGETAEIYKALSSGTDPIQVLSVDPMQFIDYTIWQNECIARPEVLDSQVDYWKKKLDRAPEVVSMLPASINGTRPAIKDYSVDSLLFDLGVDLTAAVKNFCKANAATPFMFLTSTLTALVHRLTGDEDIVIGIADGDRGHSAFDKMVGFTVNMLPIRSCPRSDTTFTTLLEEYRTACLEAYEHRSIPFDYLLQALRVPRRTAHSPVFQIAVNYQVHGAFAKVDYGDFQFTEFDHYNARIQTDFGLDIEETFDGNLQFTLDYDSKMYMANGMKKFAEQYKAAIRSIIDSKGEQNVGTLVIDTIKDRQMIAASLQPSEALMRPLHELDQELFPELFKQAVKSFPTKFALFDKSRSVTYKELDKMTNAIANKLVDSGVQVGDAVAVYCEQSVPLLVAIYGVIKAGAAYVPIDPDYPVARIESMIEDANITHFLVDDLSGKATNLFSCGIDDDCIFEIDKTAALFCTSGAQPKLNRPIRPTDPICCIFTSGSTGRPKGIYLKHSMLRYQQQEYNEILKNSAEDRIALGVAMVFDLSLCSIYGSILLGATTAIATREERYNPIEMIDMFVDKRITSVILSPTQLKALFTAPNKAKLKQWSSLRNLTACGEALPPWIVREFHALGLPEAVFYNAYAPAETTVVNAMSLMNPEDADASDCWIASPMATNKFYILDKHRNPVPLGTVGELYIGGVTVADGYANRPELTQNVFHDDRWATDEQVKMGFGKMYQTGDSFRLTEDGRLHCLGRIGGDRQVKIRGMRTELGEIEGAIFDASQQLGSDSGTQVSLAAVVYPINEKGDGMLVAYLCTSQGEGLLSNDQGNIEQYLRITLKGTLPSHMIPSMFVFVEDIPRTGSGKTDYKTLLTRPLPQKQSKASGNSQAASLTPIQEKIAVVWKQVLDVDGHIAPTDSFFALGGHSMMLISVSAAIKMSVGVELQLASMFAEPTLAGMETLCLEASGTSNHTTDEANHHISNTDEIRSNQLDWIKEASLEESANWLIETPIFEKPKAIAITGACSMIGAHFLQHVLSTTEVAVHCLAVDAPASSDAAATVFSALNQWRLDGEIPSNAADRVFAYPGSLSAANLNLDPNQISVIDTSTQAIYHLDSEVSLLKDYASIRAGNVGAIHFLLNLAASAHNNPKPIHYLSTWGVPHLQAWDGTTTSSSDWVTSEVEMNKMVPDATSELGYLKCRWACEALLCAASKRGLPVTIIRTTMCAPSPSTGASISQSDINRRIIAGSLQVGAVPDVASNRGGGMSWMTADVLTRGMWHITHKKIVNTGKANFKHIISEQHILYTELAAVLSSKDRVIESVAPEEWFQRLRTLADAEMDMHAAVLEKWWQAGWVPFKIDSKGTMAQLREGGIEPVMFDHDLIMNLVVGKEPF